MIENIGFEPNGNKVFIKPLRFKSNSLIYVPDVAKEASKIGRVEATGPLASFVKIGDFVAFTKYSGIEFPVNTNGKKETVFLITPEDELLGKVNGMFGEDDFESGDSNE